MKKFLAMGVLALGLAAISQQQASAWIKMEFGIGMNFRFESGNNSWLWGAFNNGQVPGYPTDVPVGWCPTYHYPYPSCFAGHVYGGDGHYDSHQAEPGGSKDSKGKQEETRANHNGYSGHYPVSYQYNSPAAYYQSPNYYYPSYGHYTGYGVPSYWYGHGYGYGY